MALAQGRRAKVLYPKMCSVLIVLDLKEFKVKCSSHAHLAGEDILWLVYRFLPIFVQDNLSRSLLVKNV
jgi:hypothetical protein